MSLSPVPATWHAWHFLLSTPGNYSFSSSPLTLLSPSFSTLYLPLHLYNLPWFRLGQPCAFIVVVIINIQCFQCWKKNFKTRKRREKKKGTTTTPKENMFWPRNVQYFMHGKDLPTSLSLATEAGLQIPTHIPKIFCFCLYFVWTSYYFVMPKFCPLLNDWDLQFSIVFFLW